jgi:hypothetical protein
MGCNMLAFKSTGYGLLSSPGYKSILGSFGSVAMKGLVCEVDAGSTFVAKVCQQLVKASVTVRCYFGKLMYN